MDRTVIAEIMGENFAMEKATFAAKKTEMDITTVDMSCRETYRLNAHRTMPPEKEEEVPMAVKDDGFIVKEAASMVKTEVGEQEPPEKMRKVSEGKAFCGRVVRCCFDEAWNTRG